MAAEWLINAELYEPKVLLLHEPSQYATHESLIAEIIKTTPHIYSDLIDPFEAPNPGVLVVKGRVDRYRVSVLFDTGCIGNISSLEFCEKIGKRYHAKPEYMSIMANQTFQGNGETNEPVILSLEFYTEIMKFIVTPLRDEVVLGKNW